MARIINEKSLVPKKETFPNKIRLTLPPKTLIHHTNPFSAGVVLTQLINKYYPTKQSNYSNFDDIQALRIEFH